MNSVQMWREPSGHSNANSSQHSRLGLRSLALKRERREPPLFKSRKQKAPYVFYARGHDALFIWPGPEEPRDKRLLWVHSF